MAIEINERPPSQSSSTLYERVAEGFLLDRRAQGVSPKTLRIYHQELGYFRKFLDELGRSTIEDVTAPVTRKYLLELSTHRNSGGCHLAYRVLKILTCCWEDELDGDYTSPIRKVKPPKLTKELLPPADRDEIHRMIEACSCPNTGRDKAILYCLLDTGCRDWPC